MFLLQYIIGSELGLPKYHKGEERWDCPFCGGGLTLTCMPHDPKHYKDRWICRLCDERGDACDFLLRHGWSHWPTRYARYKHLRESFERKTRKIVMEPMPPKPNGQPKAEYRKRPYAFEADWRAIVEELQIAGMPVDWRDVDDRPRTREMLLFALRVLSVASDHELESKWVAMALENVLSKYPTPARRARTKAKAVK